MKRNSTKDATLITPDQIRAARGLIDWSRERLAEESGVAMRTLARLESEEGGSKAETIETIRLTLVKAGILFIEENGGGPGVRLKKRSRK